MYPFSYVPSSPGRLVEDIAEIMKKEHDDNAAADSMYETDVSNMTAGNSVLGIGRSTTTSSSINNGVKRQTFNMSQNPAPQKKAKKSLENSWEPTDLPYVIETPVSERNATQIAKFVC